MWKTKKNAIDELGVPVRWNTETRRRCQWEAQEKKCEEKESVKTVKAYYRRVLYRAWGLAAHRGWARLMLYRRSLVQARTPHGTKANTPVLARTTTKRPLTRVI